MMTIAVFLIVQNLNVKPSPILSRIAQLMFGVFLVHYLLVQIFYDVFDTPFLPDILRIVFIAVATFATSLVVVWMLDKVPFMRKFIR